MKKLMKKTYVKAMAAAAILASSAALSFPAMAAQNCYISNRFQRNFHSGNYKRKH